MSTQTQTLTIQEFQRMMQSGDKKLPEFLQKIVEVAKPEDVREMSATTLDDETSWRGWIW